MLGLNSTPMDSVPIKIQINASGETTPDILIH